MLILALRANESIVLTGGIEIMITEIHGTVVRVGISAPPSIHIDRSRWLEKRTAKGTGAGS